MHNNFIDDDLSKVMDIKPQFVSDPADEVLADYDNHEALTERKYIFDRIFFGLLFLLIVLLAHSYGMIMNKFLIIASLASTSIYMCFPIHFVLILCKFSEWTLLISTLLIHLKMDTAQAMIWLLKAFLTLTCRMVYHKSGVPKIEAIIRRVVQEIKRSISSDFDYHLPREL